MNVSDEKRVLAAIERLEREWAVIDAEAAKKVKSVKALKKKRDLTPIQIKRAKAKKEVEKAERLVAEKAKKEKFTKD